MSQTVALGLDDWPDILPETKPRDIPKLRFPGFSGKWQNKIIGAISTKVGSGSTPVGGSSVYLAKGIPFIRSQNVNNNRLLMDDVVYISEIVHQQMRGTHIEAGDILLNITGASMGRSCVVPTNFHEGNLNQHVCIIRLAAGYIPVFVQAQLAKPKLQNRLNEIQTGGGKEGLNFQAVRSISVALPSYDEQHKIAEFLTAVDEKVAAIEKRLELLKKYKQGVMQKIFTQQIRFRDENGQDYPAWQERRINSVLTERNEQAPKSNEYPLMAFVAYEGVTPKGDRYNREFLVSDSGGKKYKRTEYADFIYSSNNLETGSIGLNRYGSASISSVYSIFQVDESCDPQFIGSYLLRKEFINKMKRFRQGVVYGQWKIHEADFLRIKEEIPSLKEQRKIANFLTALNDKIKFEESKLEQARNFKKSLLQQMFV